MHARVQHDVGAHHAADRARRADHRHRRSRIRNNLCRRGGDSAQNVKDYEAHVAHRVFDVAAEYPQEPHVADDMHPAAVQEHR